MTSDQIGIDPRGPRCAAAVTAAVLGVALVGIESWAFPALVAVQAVVAGLGALLGISAQPYVWVYDHAFAERFGAPHRLELPAGPRTAQAIAAVLLVVGLAAWFLGFSLTAATCVAAVWVVALTLAVSGYCMGCETHSVWRDVRAHLLTRS